MAFTLSSSSPSYVRLKNQEDASSLGAPEQDREGGFYASHASHLDLLASGRSAPGRPAMLRTKKGRLMRWLVLDIDGSRRILTLDKRQVIQVLDLDIPIRDMRLMDVALLGGSSDTLAQLLVRDKALVMSMEHIRMIITSDKVVVPLDDDKSELKERYIQALELCVHERAMELLREQPVHSFDASMMHPAINSPASERMKANSTSSKLDSEVLPFELHVLEFGLGETCNFLAREVSMLQAQTGPALEDLIRSADRDNLERVRRIKTAHQRFLGRVKAVRESLQRLVEDDDDMYQMCLTLARDTATAAAAAAAAAAIAESYLPPAPSFPTPPSQHAPSPFTNAPSTTTTPSRHHRSSSDGQQQHSLPSFSPFPAPHSSATNWPYSPSPALDAQQQQPQHQQQRQNSITDSFYGSGNLFPLRTSQHSPMMAPGSLAAGRSLHSVSGRRMGSHMLQMQNGLTPGAYITDSAGQAAALLAKSREDDMQDVENLLESYFMMADNTYQRLVSIGEYIDDTEDLINIQLDHSRNNLIRFEILLTTATFALALVGVVAGVLGENLSLPEVFTEHGIWGFLTINGGILLLSLVAFLGVFVFLRKRKLI